MTSSVDALTDWRYGIPIDLLMLHPQKATALPFPCI
jgi:hypothetical protein